MYDGPPSVTLQLPNHSIVQANSQSQFSSAPANQPTNYTIYYPLIDQNLNEIPSTEREKQPNIQFDNVRQVYLRPNPWPYEKLFALLPTINPKDVYVQFVTLLGKIVGDETLASTVEEKWGRYTDILSDQRMMPFAIQSLSQLTNEQGRHQIVFFIIRAQIGKEKKKWMYIELSFQLVKSDWQKENETWMKN